MFQELQMWGRGYNEKQVEEGCRRVWDDGDGVPHNDIADIVGPLLLAYFQRYRFGEVRGEAGFRRNEDDFQCGSFPHRLRHPQAIRTSEDRNHFGGDTGHCSLSEAQGHPEETLKDNQKEISFINNKQTKT